MLFLSHFIAIQYVVFTEFKENKAHIYFGSGEVFTIKCTNVQYNEFLDAISDIFGGIK